jgi:hypothetical protein
VPVRGRPARRAARPRGRRSGGRGRSPPGPGAPRSPSSSLQSKERLTRNCLAIWVSERCRSARKLRSRVCSGWGRVCAVAPHSGHRCSGSWTGAVMPARLGRRGWHRLGRRGWHRLGRRGWRR